MTTDLRNVKKEPLANGLTVITERMPYVRSVAIGIWVTAGSRQEPAELNGISHFIEHMVFKGTQHRTAEQIARSVDQIGGQLDAFTSKEMICFNAKVLDEHLPVAFDILSDMVLNPLFAEADIAKERGVVLEEIKMDADNPDYLVHEIFTQNFWRDHPIGKPVVGTRETVREFAREPLLGYFRRCFVPNRMIISAAGNLRHEAVVALVEKAFGHLKPRKDSTPDPQPVPHARITTRSKRELEQIHICLGVPSYPLPHPRRFACAILQTLLGGGMSSRLFQKIREREGLAYAIFSDLNAFRDAGVLTVYAGTSRENALQVVRLISAEFSDLKANPVSDEELRRVKDNLKGAMLLALESTSARMANWARQEIYFGEFHTLDQIARQVEAVSAAEVQEIAREFFRPELVAATVLGNLDAFRLAREHLEC